MGKVASVQPYLEPVRKSIIVKKPREETFRMFTAEIASWWPTVPHSISQERTRDVILEPRVGGMIFEVSEDGEEFPWGEILAWDDPKRLVMTWYPGRTPDTAQEIEILFSAHPDGTRIDLEHRNWQSLGAQASTMREQYEGGWDLVLNTFISSCHRGE